MNQSDLPLGFTMALAENPEALKRHSLLSESERQKRLSGLRFAESKKRSRYVDRIAHGETNSDAIG